MAEFVEQHYASEISSGRIKFRRNKKNIGEHRSTNVLINEATGKYIMFLHNDDIYLLRALEHMYEVAERFNADVVHMSFFLSTAPDGVIDKNSKLEIRPYDKLQVKKIDVMTDDMTARFNRWHSGNFGVNAQKNIFRKDFLIENGLSLKDFGGHRLFCLEWLMKAKTIARTPVPVYIKRLSPYSVTNSKFTHERVAKFILNQIKLSRYLDEWFANDDFFKDKPDFQYRARTHMLSAFDNFWIGRNGIYKNGVTPELHCAVEEAFRKYFGNDAAFPTFLFHWIHAAMLGKSVDMVSPTPLRQLD